MIRRDVLMTRKFNEKYANLINYNVPRTSTSNPDLDNSDIPAHRSVLKIDELLEPLDDGFISTYCCKETEHQ